MPDNNSIRYVTYEEFESTVDQINKNFARIDSQFEEVGHELGQIRRDMTLGFLNCKKRFDEHDRRFDEHDRRFDEHDGRFDALEKKIDDRFSELKLLILERFPKPDQAN